METAKIYVDIDSLLDTRQGALSYLMSPEKVAEYVNSEAYSFRSKDEFPVDMEAYRKHFNNKKEELLMRSTLSYINVSIKQRLQMLEVKQSYERTPKSQEVLVNIYPYNLSEDVADAMLNAVFVTLGSNTYVSLVSIAPKDLTPAYIKSLDISFVYIYNIQEWMNAQMDNLEKHPLSNVTFLFPSIYYGELDNERFKKLKDKGFESIFTVLEVILSSRTKATFLPNVYYTNALSASVYIDKAIAEMDVKTRQKEEANADSSNEV